MYLLYTDLLVFFLFHTVAKLTGRLNSYEQQFKRCSQENEKKKKFFPLARQSLDTNFCNRNIPNAHRINTINFSTLAPHFLSFSSLPNCYSNCCDRRLFFFFGFSLFDIKRNEAILFEGWKGIFLDSLGRMKTLIINKVWSRNIWILKNYVLMGNVVFFFDKVSIFLFSNVFSNVGDEHFVRQAWRGKNAFLFSQGIRLLALKTKMPYSCDYWGGFFVGITNDEFVTLCEESDEEENLKLVR